ncbi:hypothetical protein [Streptosporangium canum]|uniref:hypothetical protein n=1 Tax=Streptosporangium canum TaxID=324952 RepID=UPI0033AB41DE
MPSNPPSPSSSATLSSGRALTSPTRLPGATSGPAGRGRSSVRSARKRVTWRAATRPWLIWKLPSMKKETGTTSTAMYPYTPTSSPTVIAPSAASRAPSQVTAARNRAGNPAPSAPIQLVSDATR